jgi:hypothetical protein
MTEIKRQDIEYAIRSFVEEKHPETAGIIITYIAQKEAECAELRERVKTLENDLPPINKRLLQDIMMCIAHCDEEPGEDGLCACAWQIGTILRRLEKKHRKQIADLTRQLERFKTMSTVEMMCENENVNAHVTEWEKRCLKAETQLEEAQESIKGKDLAIKVATATIADLKKHNEGLADQLEDARKALEPTREWFDRNNIDREWFEYNPNAQIREMFAAINADLAGKEK